MEHHHHQVESIPVRLLAKTDIQIARHLQIIELAVEIEMMIRETAQANRDILKRLMSVHNQQQIPAHGIQLQVIHNFPV